MMAAHTPEPWYAQGKMIVGATPEDGQIGGCHDVADTERSVACVNTCAGLLNEQLEAIMFAIKRQLATDPTYAEWCKMMKVDANLLTVCRDLLDAFWDMSPLEYAKSRGLDFMSDAEGERIKERARKAIADAQTVGREGGT